MDDYVAVNRASWDERPPAHAASPGYSVDRFVADPTYAGGLVWSPTCSRPGGRLFIREGHPMLWSLAPGQMISGSDGEWRLSERPERRACSNTLKTRRPGNIHVTVKPTP